MPSASRFESELGHQINTCIDCSKNINNKSKRCRECASFFRLKTDKTKINWMDTNSLKERLKATSMRQLAQELGVSDTAIRKRLKKH